MRKSGGRFAMGNGFALAGRAQSMARELCRQGQFTVAAFVTTDGPQHSRAPRPADRPD